MIKPIKNNLVLELHVPNFNEVKNFYSKLGFKNIYEEPVEKELGYLVMKRKDEAGDTIINFYGGDERVYNHSFFRDFSKETRRGYEVEITIPVGNIDNYYQNVSPHIKSNLVQDLKTKRWGERDFRLADPFGFYLRFTEPINWNQ